MAAVQPKKPPGAFFQYILDIRPELIKEAGTGQAPQVTKLARERWANLSSDDKATWKKKAADKMAEYRTAVEA